MANFAMPAGTPAPRRLIVAGIICRQRGRVTRVTATEAGISGSIRPEVTR